MEDMRKSESRLCKLQGGPADGMSIYLPTTHKEPNMLIFRLPCQVNPDVPGSSLHPQKPMRVIAEYFLKYVGVQVDTYDFKGLIGA